MSTVTTIEVVDLLTIRECIEILVDRRTGHDRTPSLRLPTGNAVVWMFMYVSPARRAASNVDGKDLHKHF
jgi:hypothetical protein